MQSSVGNCMRESLLVGERNLLEICAVAVRAAQVCAGNDMELGRLRPNREPVIFSGSHGCLSHRPLWLLVLEPTARPARDSFSFLTLHFWRIRDSGGEIHDS